MSTPIEAKTKGPPVESVLQYPSYFRRIVGALQYLTLTQPDISYSVNFVSQFMLAPTTAHLKMVRCILQYVKGIINLSLNLLPTLHLIYLLFQIQIGQVVPPRGVLQ